MKGSGGSCSGSFLLNDPLSPESLVFPGAGLDGLWGSNISLVIKPFATEEEVAPPPSSFSRVRLLCVLGLGGNIEKRRRDQTRAEESS